MACWQAEVKTPEQVLSSDVLVETGLPDSRRTMAQPVSGRSSEDKSTNGVVSNQNVWSSRAVLFEVFCLSTMAVERVQVLLTPSSGGWKPSKVTEPEALKVEKSVLLQASSWAWMMVDIEIKAATAANRIEDIGEEYSGLYYCMRRFELKMQKYIDQQYGSYVLWCR